MYLIAADVGGTKTRLALVDSVKPNNIIYESRYLSGDFDSFEPLLLNFIKECKTTDTRLDINSVDTLVLALPGLVNGSTARLTNLPWSIEKQSLKNTFAIKNIHFENIYFMNDFQASAIGTGQLLEKDSIILNQGVSNPSESSDRSSQKLKRVAVGAGTGLGLAWADDYFQDSILISSVHDTEGGHIDFAPTNNTQIELLQYLQQRFGRVSYERILSGDGLVSLYQFFSGNQTQNIDAEWVNQQSEIDAAAASALSLFVQIYGAYIGNVALLFKPYGGIFITGGIAAKIVKKMQSEEFINAYLSKGRMQALVEQITVYLVTDERVGVLGAISEAIKMQRNKVQHKSLQQVSA